MNKMILLFEESFQKNLWYKQIKWRLNDFKKNFVANPYESYVLAKNKCRCVWFVDGSDYYSHLRDRLLSAEETVFITDWWMSPELFLIRPIDMNKYKHLKIGEALTFANKNDLSRLCDILKYIAKKGVKVYILLYDEISLALTINSKHTKHFLTRLNEPNIKIVRHPKRGIDLLWSHHEKLVIIDQKYAYIGGLDLCWGRYDTRFHPIYEKKNKYEIYYYPGIEYSNARIRDFENVSRYLKQGVERIFPKMPWHDVHSFIEGPAVLDVARHFVERWNFSKAKEKDEGISEIKTYDNSILKFLPKPKQKTNIDYFNLKRIKTFLFGKKKVENDHFLNKHHNHGNNNHDNNNEDKNNNSNANLINNDETLGNKNFFHEEGTAENDEEINFDNVVKKLSFHNLILATTIKKPNRFIDRLKEIQKQSKDKEKKQKEKIELEKKRTQLIDNSFDDSSIIENNDDVYDENDNKKTAITMNINDLDLSDNKKSEKNNIINNNVEIVYDANSSNSNNSSSNNKNNINSGDNSNVSLKNNTNINKTLFSLNNNNNNINNKDNNDKTLNILQKNSTKKKIIFLDNDENKDNNNKDNNNKNNLKSIKGIEWLDILKEGFKQKYNKMLLAGKHQNKNAVEVLTNSVNLQSYNVRFDQDEIRMNCQCLRSLSNWSGGLKKTERSILNAYYYLIENSEHYIYIENQFFISKSFTDEELKSNNQSVSNLIINKIALKLCDRILKAHHNRQKFRVIIFIPLLPGFAGDIRESSTLQIILKYTYKTISRNKGLSMIEKLKNQLDLSNPDLFKNYISFYSLRNHAVINNVPVTELIYIHSKLMIVDDKYVIMGSANINDRSMVGDRDSEFAILYQDEEIVSNFNSMMDGCEFKCSDFAKSLRINLWKEHLGIDESDEKNIELLNDPLTDEVWEFIKKRAKNNTDIYYDLFRCYPDDKYRFFKDIPKEEKMNKIKEQFLKEKYESVKDNIKGHIVEFPLDFLANEILERSFFSAEMLVPIKNFV
jgi:phospholipase D1/2